MVNQSLFITLICKCTWNDRSQNEVYVYSKRSFITKDHYNMSITKLFYLLKDNAVFFYTNIKGFVY